NRAIVNFRLTVSASGDVGSEGEEAMSNPLQPMEVICDAPAYAVVQACHQLGFQTPEDVRWCRWANSAGWSRLIRQPLKVLGGMSADRNCSCGQPLPELERYQFTLSNGTHQFYHLGQCRRCRTMFWEQE